MHQLHSQPKLWLELAAKYVEIQRQMEAIVIQLLTSTTYELIAYACSGDVHPCQSVNSSRVAFERSTINNYNLLAVHS